MARASFGVFVSHRTLTLERPVEAALGVSATAEKAPLEVAGSTEAWKLTVNGANVPVPTSNLRMQVEQLDGVVGLHGSTLETPVSFDLGAGAPETIAKWTLTIYDAKSVPVRTFQGEGAPPLSIPWDGKAFDGSLVTNSVARGNTSLGLVLVGGSGYRSNVLTGNNGGDANAQVSGGFQLGSNVCGTDLVCP